MSDNRFGVSPVWVVVGASAGASRDRQHLGWRGCP